MTRTLISLLIVFLLGGCGRGNDEVLPTAADLLGQPVLSTAEYLAMEPWASADIEKGERAAMICRTCHSFGLGERHKMGPNLYGLMGQQAGKVEGFEYSTAFRNAEFYWTPEAMDAFIARPHRFLPGNRMAFNGISNPVDRAMIIAYLLAVNENQ